MTENCPHCPDGHRTAPRGRPFAVWVGPERDHDGQPTTLHVSRNQGSHVAESDAEWLRGVIHEAMTTPQPAAHLHPFIDNDGAHTPDTSSGKET